MQNWRATGLLWLRRTEAFLRIDLGYLARGGSWMTLGQAAAMLVGFAVSIAFANLLPKEAFGTYKFVLSVVAILGVLAFTDMGTAVTQSVARGFGRSLPQGFRINLKWSLGIVVGGIALGTYYYLKGNFLLAFSFVLAGLLTPIIGSAGLYSAHLLGKKDFRRNALYGTVRNFVPAAALIATVFFTDNLFTIIGVYFVSAMLVCLLLYLLTRRAYAHENDRNDPGLVSYGGHLGAMNIIGTLAGNLDKILIFHYLGAAPLAIYAFAIAPVEQLQSGKKILNALILTKLSERSFEELRASVPRRTLQLGVYALALIGVYVALVPYFYAFFYPQYGDSVFYSQLYALTLVGIVGSVLESHLVAHKKKKELYVNRTVMPIMTIVLYLTLLPPLGLMGLIVTQIIVRTLSGVLPYYFIMRPFKDRSTRLQM